MIENCGELKEGEDDGIPVPADGDTWDDHPSKYILDQKIVLWIMV